MLRAAIACAMLLLAMAAFPGHATAQTCSVNAASGNYGSVDVLAGSNVDTTATFTVSCTGCILQVGCTVNVCVQFDQGAPNSNNSVRYMGSGANTVQHELYSDAARTQVWGSWGYGTTAYGTAGVNSNLTVPLLGTVNQNYTVYGRFKGSQQTAIPGTYTWTATAPDLAYSSYLLVSPNCASNPGTYANAGSSIWTATVIPNCYISASSLNFGSASLLASNVDSTGLLTVQCTNTTPYSIGLDNGTNASGTQRRMSSGAGFVSYNLFTDAARSSAWTSTTSTTSCTAGANTCVLGTGTGLSQSVTVYGRVPPQLGVPPGTYADTVIATITY